MIRDPIGLFFDLHWNLSTKDRSRELYVTPHACFGWPRGKLAAEMPWRADLLDPKDAGFEASPSNAAPSEPYEATGATSEKLWRELSDSSWQRRRRAQNEILRRGGEFLTGSQQANPDKARANDPALPSLIWLAARANRGVSI